MDCLDIEAKRIQDARFKRTGVRVMVSDDDRRLKLLRQVMRGAAALSSSHVCHLHPVASKPTTQESGRRETLKKTQKTNPVKKTAKPRAARLKQT